MTVSNQSNRTSAVGSGSTGQEVPFLFPITATSDLTVIKRLTATGVETSLYETTNYTVSISGDTGGTLTTVTTIETTEEIHIIRNTPKTQSLDLEQGGSFNAENVEDALDKNTKLAIENKDKIDRYLRFPATDPTSSLAELPNSIDRASKNLTFDSDGNPAASDSVETGSVSFTTFGEDMVGSANALAGKVVINLDHEVDVRDYDATGDTTDDITEIQAAVDSLSAYGGIVYFPTVGALYYLITSAIDLSSKVIFFEGEGAGSHIKQTGAGNAIEFSALAGTWRRGIIRMHITGDAANANGVDITGHGVVIRDSIVSNHGGWGVYYNNPSHYNLIDRSSITTNVTGGIYFDNCNDNGISHCYITGNYGNALYLTGGTDGLTVIGGEVEANEGRALYMHSANNILFEGVWFEDNNQDGVAAETFYIENCQNTTFQNCRLAENKNWYHKNSIGILYDNCRFGIVSGGTSEIVFDTDCGVNYLKHCRTSRPIIDKSFFLEVTDIGDISDSAGIAFHKPFHLISNVVDDEKNIFPYSSLDGGILEQCSGTVKPTVTAVTNDGWHDDYSYKVTFAASQVAGTATENSAVTNNNFTRAATKYYVISAMLKTGSGDEQRYRIGTALGAKAFYVDTTWRRFIQLTPQSAGSGATTIFFTVDETPAGNVDLYVDDICVFEVSSVSEGIQQLDKGLYLPTLGTTRMINDSHRPELEVFYENDTVAYENSRVVLNSKDLY